jgi:hypothetical protein
LPFFCEIGKFCLVYRQKLPVYRKYTANFAHLYMTHRKIAKHFGVTVGAIQKWEALGFRREWPLADQEAWRKAHLAGRVDSRKRAEWVEQTERRVDVEEMDEAEPETPEELAEVEGPAASMLEFADYNEARVAKIKREVERLDLKIRRERGELVLISEMRETAVNVLSIWCAELDALVGDLPGQLAGLSEPEIQPRLRSRIEILKANAKKGFATL